MKIPKVSSNSLTKTRNKSVRANILVGHKYCFPEGFQCRQSRRSLYLEVVVKHFKGNTKILFFVYDDHKDTVPKY